MYEGKDVAVVLLNMYLFSAFLRLLEKSSNGRGERRGEKNSTEKSAWAEKDYSYMLGNKEQKNVGNVVKMGHRTFLFNNMFRM